MRVESATTGATRANAGFSLGVINSNHDTFATRKTDRSFLSPRQCPHPKRGQHPTPSLASLTASKREHKAKFRCATAKNYFFLANARGRINYARLCTVPVWNYLSFIYLTIIYYSHFCVRCPSLPPTSVSKSTEAPKRHCW